MTTQTEAPQILTREQWAAAIKADGGHVITVDDGVSSFSITPGFVGFDHVDMIDWQMNECREHGRLWPETRDAFLDARLMWCALER